MNNKAEIEREKYLWLMKNTKYGSSNHGKNFISLLKQFKFNSLLDVGTGRGEFCKELANNNNKKIYGLDWAISQEEFKYKNVTFYNTTATDIPLEEKSVDITTSFDFFEHVISDDVEKIIKEMCRVTKKLLINKIATRPSKYKREELTSIFGDGELHQTQQDISWWQDTFNKYTKKTWILSPGKILISELK